MELFGMVMMNKIFKVVWSVSHSCAVVVSELAKRCGASVETNSSARIESGTHKFNISRIALRKVRISHQTQKNAYVSD